MGWSLDAAAFSCQVPDTGQTMDSGSANIYVNLAPSIGVGQNLVVDLSSSIFCRNDDGSEQQLIDYINLTNGTAFGGALAAFTGSIYWNTNSYPLPLNSSSSNISLPTITISGCRCVCTLQQPAPRAAS
jgi:minor fimbrial subunit